MTRYYDVTVKSNKEKSSISYWADSFSISNDGVLRVYSRECGDVVVSIGLD